MRIVAGRPFTQARILAGTTRLRAVLARNHTVYAALFEDHPLPIFVVDSATLDLVAVNEAARVTYGYSPEEFAVMSVLDLHPPEDRADVRAGWADPDEAAVRRRGVATHMAKDGRVFATEVVSTQLRLRGRQVRMTVVTDVTDRDNALADTEQCGLRYRQIVETAKEGVLTIDTDMAISSANQHAADLLGYPIDQLVGHPLAQFSGGDRRDSAQAQAVRQIEARQTGERETTLRRSNGTIVSVLMNQSPLLDKAGHYAGQLGMITDLTERNGLAHELAFRGVHDPLTGLPNRLLLVDRLELALGRATPGAGAVAVACVDVDAFKDVNTAHGHDGGDQILVEMAARLTGVVGLGDTVARFGGDEFVVICEGRGPFAERLAERIERGDLNPLFGRRVPHRHHRQRRRGGRTAGRPTGDPLTQRGHRPVAGQGGRRRSQPNLHDRDARQLQATSGLDFRPAPSGRTTGVLPPLPAGGLPGRPAHRRRRGPRPVGTPRAGDAEPGRVHLRGGGNRAHRPDRAMGHRGDLPPPGGLAAAPASTGPVRLAQHLGAPAHPGVAHRHPSPRHHRVGCGPIRVGVGDHRRGAHGRCAALGQPRSAPCARRG